MGWMDANRSKTKVLEELGQKNKMSGKLFDFGDCGSLYCGKHWRLFLNAKTTNTALVCANFISGLFKDVIAYIWAWVIYFKMKASNLYKEFHKSCMSQHCPVYVRQKSG